MFDNLSTKLDRAFKTLKGQGSITEINVAQTIKEVRRALVDADVNYKVAKTVTDKIKDEAMGRDVAEDVNRCLGEGIHGVRSVRRGSDGEVLPVVRPPRHNNGPAPCETAISRSPDTER